MESLLNVSSLLEKLPISRVSLYRLVQTRRIPFVRLNGKTLFFRESEIEAWLAKQSAEPAVGRYVRDVPRKVTLKRRAI